MSDIEIFMMGARAVVSEVERLLRDRALLEKVATATDPGLRESMLASLSRAAERTAQRAGISE